MPVIIFDGGKLNPEQKTKLISGLTEAAAQVTGIAKEAFVVLLRENSPENIGVGGEVLATRLANKALETATKG